jgi:carbon storage regulator CsrA
MLLIARRIGESIRIGPDIEVKIVRAGRSRVLIAVDAPRALKVLRVEPAADDGSETENPMDRRPVKLALR